jgi:hypothetical protein
VKPQDAHLRWTAFVERRHRAIIVASLLAAFLCGLSLLRLRMDLDVLGMLPQGRPAFDDFKALVADFGQLDELLVLISEADGHQTSLSRLEAFADAFGKRVAGLDSVAGVQVRVDSERFLDGILGRRLFNYLPAAGYDELERRMTPQGIDAQLKANRAILSAPFDLTVARAIPDDPFGLRRFVATGLAESFGSASSARSDGYLVAPDGEALLVIVRPVSSGFDLEFSTRLMSRVRQAEAATRSEVKGSDAVRVAYTGAYAYALEDAATLRWDVHRYTFLSLLGVLSVFYVGYRNLGIVPFLVFAMGVTTLITFAMDLLVYGRINAVSTAFAAILYGLSIDTGIHFYNRLLDERRRLDLAPAVAATLRGLGRASLAVSTTSAVVFLVIGFSCLTGVSQLGMLTAFGVLLNPVALYLLYPALAFLLPGLVGRRNVPLETPRLATLTNVIIRHARRITIGGAAAGALLAVAATRAELDAGLTHLRPRASTARAVEEEIEQRFGSYNQRAAVLVRRADIETALRDSEAVARMLAEYRDEGLLRSFETVTFLVPSERTQRERLARYNRLPRAAAVRELAAALPRLGFATAPFASFMKSFEQEKTDVVRPGDADLAPMSFLLERYIRGRAAAPTVATYFEPATAESLQIVGDRLRGDLSGTPVAVASRVLLENELHRVLRRELIAFSALSLIGNFVLLVATLGRFRDAAVVLAPVVWAVVALLAAMWWAGMALDPVNLIVPTLILGLGVDFGAFLVTSARERGGMADAFRWTGRALMVTGFTTIAGFGFLGLSRYPALAGMGILAAAGLLLSLFASILLVPALWATTRRN